VGIIIGTYSSIFIAAPVVVEWYHWRPTKDK
jgi:preprotein translocase subunit SecF